MSSRTLSSHPTFAPGRQPGVTVLDDGTTSEEDRLGAIGDIVFGLEAMGLDDDLIVIAGDNLFTAEIGDFARLGRERRVPVLAVHDVGDPEEMSKYNTTEVDGDGRITYFEEKPQRAELDPCGDRALLLPTRDVAAHPPLRRGGQRPGPARPARAVALPARALLRLAAARRLVRHRLARHARCGERGFRDEVGTEQCVCRP